MGPARIERVCGIAVVRAKPHDSGESTMTSATSVTIANHVNRLTRVRDMQPIIVTVTKCISLDLQ